MWRMRRTEKAEIDELTRSWNHHLHAYPAPVAASFAITDAGHARHSHDEGRPEWTRW